MRGAAGDQGEGLCVRGVRGRGDGRMWEAWAIRGHGRAWEEGGVGVGQRALCCMRLVFHGQAAPDQLVSEKGKGKTLDMGCGMGLNIDLLLHGSQRT